MRAPSPAVVVACALLAGCMTADAHKTAVRSDAGERLTVGTVQREIRVGMTNAQVAEILGAPNVVTTDEQRREVWVYDKIATESVHSSSAGGVAALVIGGSAGGAAAGSLSAGATATSQRTLTVIIKFDEQGRVRDFGYRQSSF